MGWSRSGAKCYRVGRSRRRTRNKFRFRPTPAIEPRQTRRSANEVSGYHGKPPPVGVLLTAGVGRVPHLANEQVQLASIEAGLAIVLPRQLESRKSILVCSNTTVGRLVQIDEATLNDKQDQCRFW